MTVNLPAATIEQLPARRRLTRDLLKAAATLTEDEARYLVDFYYQMQRDRIRAKNQVRIQLDTGEPHEVLRWLSDQTDGLEVQIKNALNRYAKAHQVGEWALGITGIGPVITAGLLAHIDITMCPTVGHIWSFAGLNPGQVWNRNTKRPWNARLKTLCWKIGESFVKVSGNPKDIYGKVYLSRKEYEQAKNEAGEYADQAKAKLERFKIGKSTEAYKHYSAGKLPPGHIHERCKRYAVKLFLAHLHHVWFELEFGKLPPKPYVIDHDGHTHFIKPPNWK